MARKHLRELLVEDQEPFLLDAYISDRRRQLNKPPKPPAHRKASSLGESLLKNANACFSSSSSPVPRRFDAAADASCDHAKMVGNSTVLLRVPTRTAALLLEAALRIENYDSKDRGDLPGCKKQGKPGGWGSTGKSLLRKFGRRSREKEFGDRECRDGVLVRDILRLGNSRERKRQGKANASKETSRQVGDCPCSTIESTQRLGRESEGSELGRSPFRYPTPELGSLAASPARSLPMDKVNDEESDRPDEPEEESEVEKEQSSPISVLDPPLYNDEDTVRRNGRAEDSDNKDGYSYEHGDDIDYEAGYTKTEGTKQQLLRKLYMFERLAGIEHVELEGRRLMEHDDEDEDGDVRPGHDSAREMMATRGMMRLVSGLVVVGGGGGEQWPNEEEEQHQPLEDAAEEIEASIIGCLVEELSDELCPQRSF